MYVIERKHLNILNISSYEQHRCEYSQKKEKEDKMILCSQGMEEEDVLKRLEKDILKVGNLW